MKTWFLMLLLTAAAAFGQATATLSQQEAVKSYPHLADPGSRFNKRFLAKVQAARVANDPILSRDDWPMVIATAVAKELKQSRQSPPPDTSAAASSTPPAKQPFTPQTTTLDQPDRLRSAADGAGKMTGNPLERGPISAAKMISGTVLQSHTGSLLLKLSGETVMIKGLPADFLVKDGTALKIKVNPAKTLAQYTTVVGSTATVDCYTAVEVPKIR